MTAIRNLARHLMQCASSADDPVLAAADAKLWFMALGHLIAINAIDVAAFAAPRLARAFPAAAFFKRTALLLDRLPPPVADAGFSRFVNDVDSEMQVFARQGASTVILAFTGRFGGLGTPLPILHRWFGAAGAHVIYLRDRTDRLYFGGISSLASDRPGTLRAIRRAVEDLGASRVACYGNSSGGYGALLYALELPAAAVLAFGAVTKSAPPDRIGEKKAVLPLPALRPIFQAARVTPNVRLVFGETNRDDADFARHLEGLPGVTLDPVPSWPGHDAQTQLVASGRMAALLSELVSGDVVADGRSERRATSTSIVAVTRPTSPSVDRPHT